MRTLKILFLAILLVRAKSLYVKGDYLGQINGDLVASWNNIWNHFWKPTGKGGDVAAEKDDFDELQALSLIPTIINLYRNDLLFESEKAVFSQIYGSLWFMIDREVFRGPETQIDPLMKIILDIAKLLNSGEPFNLREQPNTRKISIRKSEDPSQRLLKMVATFAQRMIPGKQRGNNRQLVRPQIVQLQSDKRNIGSDGRSISLLRSLREDSIPTYEYSEHYEYDAGSPMKERIMKLVNPGVN
ncbi:unnamed protein product [Hermetia illucens]|uniref:Uncharacterized protein n=1 Tax=Hermetia illucens TaxID=343691 RepID=A0A7R8UR33_HERIL|nr:unnamed protein product [Hermetia illucens]